MDLTLIAILLLDSLMLGADEAVPTSPDAVATLVVLRSCAIDFDRASVLGAVLPGVLQECHVRPGDKVKANQVIGRLLDDDVRAELELRKAESESDIDVRLAKAKHAQALSRLRRSMELHRKSFLSSDELGLHQLEAESMALSIEESEHRRRLAELQSRQARAAVRSREFVAPHDGVVVDVMKGQGESVTYNEPVFRIVNTDRLRVTGHLDIFDAWRVRKDQVVRISPDISGVELELEQLVFEGKVVFVDSQIDPETRTCKVIAEVENRNNLLRSGISARMEILPDVMPASRPGPGPADAKTTPAAARPVSSRSDGPAPKGRGAGEAQNPLAPGSGDRATSRTP